MNIPTGATHINENSELFYKLENDVWFCYFESDKLWGKSGNGAAWNNKHSIEIIPYVKKAAPPLVARLTTAFNLVSKTQLTEDDMEYIIRLVNFTKNIDR